MNILLILKDPCPVDGGDPHFIPLYVVHVVLVDPELRAGQRNTRHLILERADVKRTRDHVVQKKLGSKPQYLLQ